MSYPRKTDVAKHLSRKLKLIPKVRPEIISMEEVPSRSRSSDFLTESATAKPGIIPDDLTIAVRSAQNEDKRVGQ